MASVKAHADGRDITLSSSQGPFTSPPASNVAPIRQTVSPDVFAQQSSSSLRPFNSQRNDRHLDELSPHMQPVELGMFGGSALEDSPLQTTAILMRGLPATMSQEALISMFLFSEDYIDAQFTARDFAEEGALLSAVARFRSFEGACDARQRLHGKQNATNNGTMLVEVLPPGGSESPRIRRKASDVQPSRQLSNSASSGSSNGQGTRQSRFNKTFQFMDKLSPTRGQQGFSDGDLLTPDASTSMNKFFSPSNRVGSSFHDQRRMSGKAVINDDSADDETGELIKDPLMFMKNGQKASARRASANHQMPISRMAGLSLNTNNGPLSDMNAILSPTDTSAFGSARPSLSLQSPIAEMSPNSLASGITPMSPSNAFQLSPQQFQPRHQYPPANPADQNPPCNTLYVGNLPVDTSEDELKAMFSKQRGYKRLCFRTKHNGPMCFVEFEDITFATKALNELYGQPLHNSVKGGIRLSFSKNPLGVRSGQSNSVGGPQSPLASPTSNNNFGNVLGAPPGFGSAIAPPPGLSAPPGLSPPIGMGSLNHATSPATSTNLYPHGNSSLSGHSPQAAARSGQHGVGGAYIGAGGPPNSYNPAPNGFVDFNGGR